MHPRFSGNLYCLETGSTLRIQPEAFSIIEKGFVVKCFSPIDPLRTNCIGGLEDTVRPLLARATERLSNNSKDLVVAVSVPSLI